TSGSGNGCSGEDSKTEPNLLAKKWSAARQLVHRGGGASGPEAEWDMLMADDSKREHVWSTKMYGATQ
ncbi:hypothetical protein MMC29_003231, partial [Sticta canariensis]|nr:hypothetical protein [Sticta canariensis]